MNRANVLPAKLPAGVTQRVSLKDFTIDKFSPGVTLRYYMDLGDLQYIYTLVSTRKQKFRFNTPVSVLMSKNNQTLFLQFPTFSNHPVVVLQADNSNSPNESQ